MRAEILAVGTELLLGQIVDTNSTFIAEELAAAGIDCHFQTRVGDNLERIVEALEVALGRSDAVVVCGGLGPTQDDITREAIAKVMGVALVRDEEALAILTDVFARRNRTMSPSNLRQADVPQGAAIIQQVQGTAPGLICPVGEKVLYALPGVPHEMREMVLRAVLPDLEARSGVPAVIASRTLRTWGLGESVLAETIASRLDELDAVGPGAPTIAFLASGIEGIKVRVTVKAPDLAVATARLDEEETVLRAMLGEIVFGTDDETMEFAVGDLLQRRGQTLATAESFTGGLISARVVAIPGASRWFRGGLVSYASEVKFDLLGLPEGPVVSAVAAAQMAEGARKLLDADVGLSTTGVAGPDPQDGLPPGTAFVGIALPGAEAAGFELSMVGSRNRMRDIATISSLDVLRRHLLATAE
ncbi:MAG TPA: competence/damage-inducible protein A [Acidimicrobiales bacterium]|nr:competence/damage-inducible protein A [Acidimicrobiales bacterium]